MIEVRSPAAVIGVDAGATHTRIVAATSDGRVLGRWRRPGTNPWSSEAADPAILRDAVADAVAAVGSLHLAGAVIGVAGLVGPVHERVEAQLAPLVAKGIRIRVVPDVVVNHAAGDSEPAGFVVAAGTGAIAAAVSHGSVQRQVDGHGWRFGDQGSSVWIGVQAVRATLRALDGRGPRTALADMIVSKLVGPGPHDQAIVHLLTTVAMERAGASLGRIASDVLALTNHDAVAREIVTAAAEHLAETALAVTDDWSAARRIVFAGSLLLGAPVIAHHVARCVESMAPHVDIVEGPDGAAGAASLAFHLAGSPLSPHVHETLCRPRRLRIPS